MGGRRWAIAFRLARRDFSWRFRGLRLLIICLFLGAGTLAAIGTLESTIRQQLADRGTEILGGDIELAIYARKATDEERGAIAALGTISEGMRMQAMAAAGAGADTRTAPVQLKSVDAAWPLYGTMRLSDGTVVRAPPDGDAWAGQGVLDRLGIKVGDAITLGETRVRIAGVIGEEPDRLSEGFALGPPLIVSNATLARAGLVQFGSMTRTKFRVALPDGADPQNAIDDFAARFEGAGWESRTRDRASPGADRLLTNMGEFLSLVGLAAMVIAGIGIAGAVSSWLESRRGHIATLKVLGAESGDIFRIHLLQILAASVVGVGLGLLAGVLAVPVLASMLEGLLPVRASFTLDPIALARASGFSLLVAAMFAAPPLYAARSVAAMALLRARVAPPRGIWRGAAVPVVIAALAIVALALATAEQMRVTGWFMVSAAVVLGLLAAIGFALRGIIARLPRGRSVLLRIGIVALDRPGTPTVGLVTALGFGLAAFCAIAAIQTSLDNHIAATVPKEAPDYIALDVPRDREGEFRTLVEDIAPGAAIRTVPALRGSILAYGPENAMTRVSDLDSIPEGAWALRGERGLTYSATLPDGNVVTAGNWWPADYMGEPLVSIDEELADALDLKIGDMLSIGILGVERQARIASFRRIEWQDMGFNYALVFAPGAIDDAPHNLAATVIVPDDAPRAELLAAMVRDFPGSAMIEIGPVVTQARDLLESLSAAILGTASMTVLAGLAVLLGAIAAARARETYDTIVLRVLGASRAQLLGALALRYFVLAALLSAVALALGGGAAWFVMERLFDFAFRPDWTTVLLVLFGGAAMIVAVATLASLPVLSARPARALRSV